MQSTFNIRIGMGMALALWLGGRPAVHATDRTWDGGGGDDNWSTEDNWDGTAPVADDALFFDGSTRLTPNNDIVADTAFGGITFNAGAGAFTLGGNRITLGGNVASLAANDQIIGLNIILGATRTFDVSGDGELTLSGDLSGDGGLTKTGAGTLVLSGANTYTNVTTLSAGTIRIGATTAFGTSSGPIVVESGATLDVFNNTVNTSGGQMEIAGTGTDGIGALYNSVTTASGGSITDTRVVMTADATISRAGAVSRQTTIARDDVFDMDGYTLTKGGSGTVTFRDTTVTNAGNIIVSSGYLRFQDARIYSEAPITITVNDGARLDFWRTIHVQDENVAMSGSGAQFTSGSTGNRQFSGTVTLTGANNQIGSSYQYPTMHLLGKITGNGGFSTLASAANRWVTLSLGNNENDYTGDTVVSERNTLRVSNTSGSATGSGTVTVQSGGVLSGTGIIGGNGVVNGGGILSPANVDGQIGTLTFNSNLTLDEYAVLAWDFDETTHDLIAVGGAVTLPATLDLDLNNLDASTPASIPLITAAGGFTGTAPTQWDAITIEGIEYRFRIEGDTLLLGQPRGTLIMIR